MSNRLSPPAILLRAAARARVLHDRITVVKLGGSAMEDPAATLGTLEAAVALQTLGIPVVLVHGGGKPIDRAMATAGLEPRKVAGRRYTDDATLEIVVRVLHELMTGLVTRLNDLGGRSVGFHSAVLFGDRLTLPDASGQPIDLGRVGTVTRVDTDRLQVAIAAGRIPVIPSVGQSVVDGGWLNINADTAAAAVAGSLHAHTCDFLTDTPGVLRDRTEPDSLIPRLTRSECERLIAEGAIAGGMVPKVEACFEALAAGAGRAVIRDGRDPHALLHPFVTDDPHGTEIVP